MNDEVLTSVDDGIMTITINRPEAKNACNRQVAELIAAAMDRLDSDDTIRVAILNGANNTFCSGMDLKAFMRGELPIIEGRGFGGFTERPPRKPLIAAVEGHALAGGFELAIACDLIVAADNALFGIPEVKRGLIAAAGGLVRTPRQIPPRIAMELALTGDFINAQRAYELGLVNRIAPAGEVYETASKLASVIAANGPLAVITSKQIVAESQEWTGDSLFRNQDASVQLILNSQDAREGAKAFAEKRPPEWAGC